MTAGIIIKIVIIEKSNKFVVYMACRAILMIAFPWVRTIYIYIFLCPLEQVCIVYVVKEFASLSGAKSIIGCGV